MTMTLPLTECQKWQSEKILTLLGKYPLGLTAEQLRVKFQYASVSTLRPVIRLLQDEGKIRSTLRDCGGGRFILVKETDSERSI